MDHKAWIWRKKSSEKTKLDVSSIRNVEEILPTEKEVGLDKSVKDLNEKLASALLDCQAKDELLTKHAKMAQEAIAGREKAEAEAKILKQELDEAMSKGVATDAALKECMQQLSSLREEQEQKLRDAVTKATIESENLAVENANLSQALQVKEKLIKELRKSKTRAEAEFDALMARSDSTEKENAFLKYEFHMLEKELDIRGEELEFYRRLADVSQKQNTEIVKKITKLEAECQRLRVLMLRGDRGGVRRRKPNPTRDFMVRDTTMERLHEMEEENKILKEIIAKKNAEVVLHSSRITSARITSSRSLQAESLSRELSLTSGFDIGSDDGISSSGSSWANALISELEHFRNERLKNPPERNAIKDSDMSLMDDFVEMEKLAIVSVDTPPEVTDKDLFPVVVDHIDTKQEIISRDAAMEKPFDWLQEVLNAMLKQNRVSKRSLDELLEDIRIALGYINHPISPEINTMKASVHPEESDCLNLWEENRRLKDELKNIESVKKDMEVKLQSATDRTEALMIQIEELKSLKESKEMIEDRVEHQNLINEDLETEAQLTVAKAKLNEVFQKFTSLEVELEDKRNCCEELEATCLELQLQLESVAKKETLQYGINEEEKQSQTGWEITAASVKLAECQETILNLGKQLQALASPREAAIFDNKNLRKLRDRMLAEDGDRELLQSPKIEESISSAALILGSRHEVGALAIVPIKKQGGGGFLRKLLLRRKKGSSKKRSLAAKG